MEQVKKDNSKLKTILKCIVIITIYGIIMAIIDTIFGKIEYFQEHEVTQILIRSIIMLIILLTYMYYTKRLDVFKFNKKKFFKGLLIGLPLIVIYAGMTYSKITSYPEEGYQFLPIITIIICVISMLMIGITEEVLFRGIVLNDMFKTYGRDTRKNVITAIIASAILFMVVHLTNVLSPDSNIINASYQAIVSFFGGLVYSAIYARSGDIYSVSLIHGLQDICGGIESGFFGMHKLLAIVDTSDKAAVAYLFRGAAIVCIVNIIIFLIIIRKKKAPEYIETKEKES